MEYKIDSFNYLKFTPTFSYNETETDNITDFSFLGNSGTKNNDGSTRQNSRSTSPNLNGNLLYNHRFARRGRTLSVNMSAGKSNSDGNIDYQNLSTYYLPNGQTLDTNLNQRILQNNRNYNYGIRASYVEPLSKKMSRPLIRPRKIMK